MTNPLKPLGAHIIHGAVEFHLPGGRIIQVRPEKNGLRLYTPEGVLVILPHVSNVVYVGVRGDGDLDRY